MEGVRMRILCAIGVAVSLALAVGTADADSVTYQNNIAHSGRASLPGFMGSLKLLWSRNLGMGAVSYPLISGGLVFVTAASNQKSGTELFALDASTGTIAWRQAIAGSHHWSNASYESGLVFVVNFDGAVQAFAAASGSLNWSVQLKGQTQFSSPPASQTGLLYLAGGDKAGTVYALDESDGSVNWTADVEGGAHSSPVLGPSGVYVTYPCQYYKFAPQTGALLWHDDEGCHGKGGLTAVWYKSLLFVRDRSIPNSILNAQNGDVTGTFAAQPAPALFNRGNEGFGVSLAGGNLSCFSIATGKTVWSFTGDNQLTTAPLAVGGYVIEGSGSGNLYALDSESGKQVWSGNVGAPIPAPDEDSVAQPLTGLGAGDGIIVVPAGAQISAYQPR
jgi:outer membrane protein assembly factor BamB